MKRLGTLAAFVVLPLVILGTAYTQLVPTDESQRCFAETCRVLGQVYEPGDPPRYFQVIGVCTGDATTCEHHTWRVEVPAAEWQAYQLGSKWKPGEVVPR